MAVDNDSVRDREAPISHEGIQVPNGRPHVTFAPTVRAPPLPPCSTQAVNDTNGLHATNSSELNGAARMLFGSPTPSIEGTGGQPTLTNGSVETRYAGPQRPPDGQEHQGTLRMIADRQMIGIQRQSATTDAATNT